jgi:hypothetical protein
MPGEAKWCHFMGYSHSTVAKPENQSISYRLVRLVRLRVATLEKSALKGGSRLVASGWLLKW